MIVSEVEGKTSARPERKYSLLQTKEPEVAGGSRHPQLRRQGTTIQRAGDITAVEIFVEGSTLVQDKERDCDEKLQVGLLNGRHIIIGQPPFLQYFVGNLRP